MTKHSGGLSGLVVAVVLLAGCSAGSTTPVDTSTGPAPTTTPQQTLGPAPHVTNSQPPGLDASGNAIAPPTNPGAGRFKDVNKTAGTDPDAILEAGTSTCDRASYLAQVDASSLVEGIKDGDLAMADTAIPLLCPQYAPQLLQALGGFGDGTFTVGGQVKAGQYVAKGAPAGCVWKVVGEGGATIASGSIDAGDTPSVDLATGGAVGMTSTSCVSWLPVS